MQVAVFGASGYTGLELLRILLRHPRFELAVVTSEQRAGEPVGDAFPSLRGQLDLRFTASADAAALAREVDLAFTALPHAASAPTVAALRKAGVPVLDLSADFRLHDPAVYREWYGEHPAPGLLAGAVYGLPELHREALRKAELVAVPGCYPTSAILPLAPFLREGLVETTGHRDRLEVGRLGRRPQARGAVPVRRARRELHGLQARPRSTGTRRRSSRRRARSRAGRCA